MRKYELTLEGKTKSIWAKKVGSKIWYHIDGQTNCFETKSKSSHSSSSAQSSEPGVIKAPMPGKIIKVSKKVGESADEGDNILVMEAMKMEYSLDTDLSGDVTEIKVSEGDQVTMGQILAVVK